MKRKYIGLCALITVTLMAACNSAPQGSCRIHGVVDDDRLNGKQIFLVPLEDDSAEAVDSVYIKDGKFEFATDTCHMAQIVMDYHFRDGVERLLVVTEPGDLNVTIGRVSSSSGTPGNDSLEVWKKATINHTREMATLKKAAQEMAKTDTVRAKQLLAQADSVHVQYKRYTRQLASSLQEGALREFLSGLYPTSYPKRMPDGTVVTVHEEE